MLALRRTLVTAIIAVSASVCAQAPATSPAEGTIAPALKLQDQAGKWHTLEQYKGKWVVLYFYPKDFTGGCTTQACELRDNIFAFKKADAVILGVSVDDVGLARKIRQGTQPAVRHPRRSDQGGVRQVWRADDLWHRQLASRQTFLIGPDGKIVKHWAKVDPKGHSDMVLAEIKAHTPRLPRRAERNKNPRPQKPAFSLGQSIPLPATSLTRPPTPGLTNINRIVLRVSMPRVQSAQVAASFTEFTHGAIETVQRQRKHAARRPARA